MRMSLLKHTGPLMADASDTLSTQVQDGDEPDAAEVARHIVRFYGWTRVQLFLIVLLGSCDLCARHDLHGFAQLPAEHLICDVLLLRASELCRL